MGSLAADAEAACASLIFAAREACTASASAASAAAQQSRHFLEASGLRAWVLVKLEAGRPSCLQILQESDSPLPSTPPPLPLLLLALCSRNIEEGTGAGGGVRSWTTYAVDHSPGRWEMLNYCFAWSFNL